MHRSLRPLLALVLAGLLLPSFALAAGPRQVRLHLTDRVTLRQIQESGLDIVELRDGLTVEILEWPGDAAIIAALGARAELVDDDPGLHAAQRARAELARQPAKPWRRVRTATRPDGVFRIEAAPPEGSGSLGGFWTLAEVKMKLDDLVDSDTRDLVADQLDTLGYSLHGRPIWGLKLGTPVADPDTRPAVYFNALTHAREPGGMQALLHFVDDLLAAYDTDPVAQYLLEHRQIYFCPVVNPDGYWYNQRIYDSTGTFGYWRKNLRDNNGSGTTGSGDGVDLNRNYGYLWGYNSSGSSGTPSSETYRGPSAFSEIETRVQRDAVVARRPVTGLSFHTYSELFVHPWGWTTAGTPDSVKFQIWSDEFTLGNGFASGPGPRILYEVNGDFNDWTYGDTLLKPRGFTWTPELGGADDGFWPPPSRLDAINESAQRACWQVTGMAGPWLVADRTTIAEGYLNAGNYAHLAVRARNIGGSGQAGPSLQAALTALDAGVTVLSGPVGYPTLGPFASADPDAGGSFFVTAADTVTPGRMVRFRVDFTDPSGLFNADTIEVVIGTPTVLVLDPCQSLAGWTVTSGPWGVRTNDPNHPSAYIADSPAGVYSSDFNAQLRLASTLDLSHGVHAWAFFENRFGFEQEWDAGLFEASVNGTSWTALPGIAPVTSHDISIVGAGLSIFGGTRWRWRADRVDLSAYAGNPLQTQLRLRWRSLADAGTNFDGMNFDSMRVHLYDPAAQPEPVTSAPIEPRPRHLHLSAPAPNPARGLVSFAFETPDAGELRLDVLDVQGRVVYSRAASRGEAGPGRYAWGWDLRDRAGRAVPPGLYLIRLRTSREAAVRRLIVLP